MCARNGSSFCHLLQKKQQSCLNMSRPRDFNGRSSKRKSELDDVKRKKLTASMGLPPSCRMSAAYAHARDLSSPCIRTIKKEKEREEQGKCPGERQSETKNNHIRQPTTQSQPFPAPCGQWTQRDSVLIFGDQQRISALVLVDISWFWSSLCFTAR